MNRAHKFAVLVGAAIALWFTFALRGQFLHKFVAVSSLIATAVLFLAWILFRALRKPAPRIAAARHVCSWLGVVLLVISLSYVSGIFVRSRDVHHAQQFCEQLAASAEDWRDEHGSYPETLEQVMADGLEVPHLLQNLDNVYVSDGEAYVLSFSDQAGMLDSAMFYTSQDREWYWVPLND
jgi:hypothetical protein